ncbi:MAG TPA: insulinase family protein, partial [Phycisphaerae bacterium]|nr:insulinase family protein [Phycisphaerae bacterium]
ARDYGLNPDEPEQLAERQLLAAMFPDHPYQHPPGFVAESLKDTKPIDVQEFLDRWFVPGNATLFIIGDVSTVSALELARKHFGSIQWREPPRRAEPPRVEDERVRHAICRRDHPTLTVAWRTPPMGYFENAAIDVLMHGLLNEFDGPLYEALMEAGYQFPAPYWYRHGWRHGGWLVLRLGLIPYTRRSPVPRDEPEAIKQVLDQWLALVERHLAQAKTRVPDPIAHNRARALTEREARRRHLALWDRALELARQEVVGGDLLLADFEIPRIQRVAVADVQAAAMLLNETRRVIIEYRPDAPASAALLPVLPARAALRQLGPAELFDHLRPYAAGAPQPATPTTHPELDFATIHEHIPVTACRLPGMRRATVAFLTPWPSDPHRRIWIRNAPRLRPWERRGDHGQMLDYASYYGVVRQQARPHLYGEGGPCGEIATADPQRALAMLEWFAKTIPHRQAQAYRRPVSSLPFKVFAVGDTRLADVTRVVEPILAEHFADQTADAASAVGEESPDSPSRRAQGRELPKVRVIGNPSPEPTAYVGVLITWRAPEQTPTLRPLEARALALLLGRGLLYTEVLDPFVVEPLDDETTGLWRCWTLGNRAVEACARVDLADLERTVRAFHARFKAIQNSTIPLPDVALALRLAQTEQLVRLDSPAAIVEELSWSQSNPWLIGGDLSPDGLSKDLAAACDRASVLIRLVGGDEATHARLRELEEPAD